MYVEPRRSLNVSLDLLIIIMVTMIRAAPGEDMQRIIETFTPVVLERTNHAISNLNRFASISVILYFLIHILFCYTGTSTLYHCYRRDLVVQLQETTDDACLRPSRTRAIPPSSTDYILVVNLGPQTTLSPSTSTAAGRYSGCTGLAS